MHPAQGQCRVRLRPSSSVLGEDVLEVYHRRFEDNEVLVCLDETSKQLVQETRQPLPPRPGAATAYDYEYQRNRGEQPVHAVRALGGVAAGGGDGPANQG